MVAILIPLLLPIVSSLLMYEKGKCLMITWPVPSDDRCLEAMCEVDSGCVPHGCSLDHANRVGCGYFRLNIYQFRQCYQPGKREGEDEEEAWVHCAHDYGCSSSCIRTLASRFRTKCYGKSDCETMARIHDGGANGCRTRDTQFYWRRVHETCGHNCLKPILRRH